MCLPDRDFSLSYWVRYAIALICCNRLVYLFCFLQHKGRVGSSPQIPTDKFPIESFYHTYLAHSSLYQQQIQRGMLAVNIAATSMSVAASEGHGLV